MPSTSRVLASLTLSSLIRHHRLLDFCRLDFALVLGILLGFNPAVSELPAREDGFEAILLKVERADAAADRRLLVSISLSRDANADPDSLIGMTQPSTPGVGACGDPG